jgi:hypothetical protein
MTNSAQERLVSPATRPKLHLANGAAQTRIVSMARIWLGSRESARAFRGIIWDDISEFESHMPSHAVGLSQVRSPAIVSEDASQSHHSTSLRSQMISTLKRKKTPLPLVRGL